MVSNCAVLQVGNPRISTGSQSFVVYNIYFPAAIKSEFIIFIEIRII